MRKRRGPEVVSPPGLLLVVVNQPDGAVFSPRRQAYAHLFFFFFFLAFFFTLTETRVRRLRPPLTETRVRRLRPPGIFKSLLTCVLISVLALYAACGQKVTVLISMHGRFVKQNEPTATTSAPPRSPS
jgi:hypothetical protein